MSRSPSILLFISDQQRTDTLGCYSNDWIWSPHRDALVAQIRIWQHETQDTVPLPAV